MAKLWLYAAPRRLRDQIRERDTEPPSNADGHRQRGFRASGFDPADMGRLDPEVLRGLLDGPFALEP